MLNINRRRLLESLTQRKMLVKMICRMVTLTSGLMGG